MERVRERGGFGKRGGRKKRSEQSVEKILIKRKVLS
jgi:hypothetical protein